MATQRVIDYWQTPAPPDFVDYVLTRANLTGDYLTIAKNYRAGIKGNTDFFAEKADMDKRNFNAKSAIMHRAVMSVLIDLAIDGWKARQKEAAQYAKK